MYHIQLFEKSIRVFFFRNAAYRKNNKDENIKFVVVGSNDDMPNNNTLV